jgi:hypothetical protein
VKYSRAKTVQRALEPGVIIMGIATAVEYLTGGHIPKDAVYAVAAGAYGVFCAIRNWIKNR